MSAANGLVHLYTGGGKGKTTAAVGLAVRALGAGKRVLFCQFLKGGDTAELEPLSRLGARILRAKHGVKFTFQMTPEELADARARHESCLADVQAALAGGETDVLILDEAVDAVNAGLIDGEALARTLSGRPAAVEAVLTGRNPDARLVALADYHTEFVCRAHPYQKGIPARRGIEY